MPSDDDIFSNISYFLTLSSAALGSNSGWILKSPQLLSPGKHNMDLQYLSLSTHFLGSAFECETEIHLCHSRNRDPIEDWTLSSDTCASHFHLSCQ